MNNLIYLCHFGDTVHGNFLKIAIAALRLVGKYQGDILVFSDKPSAIIEDLRLLNPFGPIDIIDQSSTRGLFTRYSAGGYLAEHYSDKYEQFIYIDNDMIAQRDLSEFISGMRDNDFYCFADAVYTDIDFNKIKRRAVGLGYYPNDYQGKALAGNPALFAFKPTDAVKVLFNDLAVYRKVISQQRYSNGADIECYSFALSKLFEVADIEYLANNIHKVQGGLRGQLNYADDQPFVVFENYVDSAKKLSQMYQVLKRSLGDEVTLKDMVSQLNLTEQTHES